MEVIKTSDLATMLIESGATDKATEIAKKALQNGFSVEDIIKITDLDIKTIQLLKDELDGVFPKTKKKRKS